MPLSCTDTNNYRLIYQKGVLVPRLRYIYQFDTNGNPSYQNIETGQEGDIYGYTIETNIYRNQYVAVGTYTNVSSQNNGEIRYYSHLYTEPSLLNSFEYSTNGGAWYFNLNRDPGWTQAPRSLFGNVYDITQAAYELSLSEDISAPQHQDNRRIGKSQSPTPPTSYFPAAVQLGEAQIKRFGSNEYVIYFTKNGQPIGARLSKGYREDRYSPDPELVDTSEVETIALKTRDFTKEIGTQAVEVLVDPDNGNKKNLWLVNLDEEGNETGRSSIFSWETFEGQRVPSGRIECLEPIEIEECPDNTYQFDCGTHLCCYQPDGYAHSRIEK